MVRNPTCPCPYTQALFTLLGKKWVMFILQVINHGAHTFTEIRRQVGGANTKILTDRLIELIDHDIITKEESKYILTPLGQELITRLLHISHWWGEENLHSSQHP